MRIPTTLVFGAMLLGCPSWGFAKNLCTVVLDAETGKSILQEGPACAQRITPASTFKIAISLMGFDAGILKTTQQPVWIYQTGYPDWGGDPWKGKVDPATWMQYSVFWYSQQVVEKLGQAKFEHYVKQFGYGNQDVSAVPVKHAGQQGVWVVSSLQISALEQVDFLCKVVNRQLPISDTAYDMTEALTQSDVRPDGWIVYGKTGTGSPGTDGHYDASKAYGWYVGWAHKGKQKIVFAQLDQDESAQKPNNGMRVRDQFLQRLPSIMSN